jgi:TRAP-type mannitol/chloroaromatic compound transport system permease large subunit
MLRKFWARFSLLLLALLLGLITASLGARATETESELPVETKGTLIVFNVQDMRCVLYVNEQGMASGAGTPSCVPLMYVGATVHSNEFQILRVIKTRGHR